MIGAAVKTDTRASNAVSLRIGSFASLSSHETKILQGLPQQARSYPAQTELCTEQRVQSPLMLLSGWACYQRILGDGRRQILRFILPGDAIGSLARPVLPALSTAVAITPVLVADARPLIRRVEADEPLDGFAAAITMMSHADEINSRDHVVRLGRQNAYERLTHLILELHVRLQTIGMVDGSSFAVPVSQEILADALGLSVVHVNRTLQQVRRDKLLEMRGGRVTIYELDTMRDVANWVASAAA